MSFKENQTPPQTEQSSKIDAEAFILHETILEGLEEYEENKLTNKLYDRWNTRFRSKPEDFFSEENLNALLNKSLGERLTMLAYVVHTLKTTPQLVEKYCRHFPDIAQAIVELFRSENGKAGDGMNYFLYTISAEIMKRVDPDLPDTFFRTFRQYEESTERRKQVPLLLMKDFDENFPEYFKEFNPALIDNLNNVINEATDPVLGKNRFMRPEKLFDEHYESLNNETKAAFLRKCLAHFHSKLLYEETYDSSFTAELVDKDNIHLQEQYKKGLGWLNGYEVGHSMIFGTEQPFAAYQYNQDYFLRLMNTTAKREGYLEEYSFHRLIIAVLDKLKGIPAAKETNIDSMLDFWSKNKNPIFANSIATALSSQDANVAASKIMEYVRKETHDKRYLTALLYRLELGRVGISEEGVNYLERMYDLAEYNNSHNYVERLTNEGEIGIFNEEQKLIKYFHLGDLSTPEKRVRATLLDITYETLFVGKPDESTEERGQRLRYLEEFKQNYYRLAHDAVFKTTGIALNNLSFKEQGWFLIYFNQANEAEKKRLRDFITTYGEEGIKTFLSLEQGFESGRDILALSETLDRETARGVFLKFNELAGIINRTNSELTKLFFADAADKKPLSPFQEVLKRGRTLLQHYAQTALSGNKNTENKKAPDIMRELTNIQAETVWFASLFKTAFQENHNLTFEDIEGIDFQYCTADALTEQEQVEILDLAQTTYHHEPPIAQEVANDINGSFAKGKASIWFRVKQNKELIACIRFDRLSAERFHAGSFMVKNSMTGSAIGMVLENETMDEMAKQFILEAVAEMRRPVASHYIEKKGFVVTGVTRDERTGVHLFNLERDDRLNPRYRFRQPAETAGQNALPAIAPEQAGALYEGGNLDELRKHEHFQLIFMLSGPSYQLPEKDIENIAALLKAKPAYVISRLRYITIKERPMVTMSFERKFEKISDQPERVAT